MLIWKHAVREDRKSIMIRKFIVSLLKINDQRKKTDILEVGKRSARRTIQNLGVWNY